MTSETDACGFEPHVIIVQKLNFTTKLHTQGRKVVDATLRYFIIYFDVANNALITSKLFLYIKIKQRKPYPNLLKQDSQFKLN